MKSLESKILVFLHLGIKGLFITCASFELSVTRLPRPEIIFGEKFQPPFSFVFCKIIYIWNILIIKETSSLSFACLYV